MCEKATTTDLRVSRDTWPYNVAHACIEVASVVQFSFLSLCSSRLSARRSRIYTRAMARKKTVNGPASITSSDSEHVSTKPLLSATLVGDPSTSGTNIDILSASANIEREQIKVNNANLSDLKNSCDDVVKRVRRHYFYVAMSAAALFSRTSTDSLC